MKRFGSEYAMQINSLPVIFVVNLVKDTGFSHQPRDRYEWLPQY